MKAALKVALVLATTIAGPALAQETCQSRSEQWGANYALANKVCWRLKWNEWRDCWHEHQHRVEHCTPQEWKQEGQQDAVDKLLLDAKRTIEDAGAESLTADMKSLLRGRSPSTIISALRRDRAVSRALHAVHSAAFKQLDSQFSEFTTKLVARNVYTTDVIKTGGTWAFLVETPTNDMFERMEKWTREAREDSRQKSNSGDHSYDALGAILGGFAAGAAGAASGGGSGGSDSDGDSGSSYRGRSSGGSYTAGRPSSGGRRVTGRSHELLCEEGSTTAYCTGRSP